jgi:flagella basal body P-ring formation protein FlgA
MIISVFNMKRASSVAFLVTWMMIGGWQTSAACAQQIEIELKAPTVACFDNTIRIKDIAEIRSRDPQLRRYVAELDLEQFTEFQTQIEISERLVHYRLLVAGIKPSQFTISGQPLTMARFSEPINTSRTVERAIQNELATQFGLPRTSLEITVNRQIESVIQGAGLDPASLMVQPSFPAELPIGNRSVEIVLSDGAGNSLATSVSAKIAVYRDLVIAKRNISRGELLSEDKIERVRRPVDSSQVRFASFEQAVGKTARTDIQQFALLKTQFVSTAKQTDSASQPVIKRNDRLNVIIKRGPMSVTLKGALATENGKPGDYIDLINPKSKERVRARIIDAGTAVIEF